MIKATAFYPEYLPRARWEASFAQVADAGIEAIRFGEFAWGVLEPEEGEYRWEVFDAAFDMAERFGLKVMLCTPTACPPVWLAQGYPDALPVNDRGERVGFGGRQHRCYNSLSMREHTRDIVARLAERYGRRPCLMGWQIDNEIAAEHKYCFCPRCHALFHQFLEAKYRTIEALNERWLTSFWAQNYRRFDQIPLPTQLNTFLPVRHHPSLIYEFLRFSSESAADFSDMQADIIRRHSDLPISTNQDDFKLSDNVDWYRMFESLDYVGFDLYSQNLYELAFYFDLCRSVKNKPFWQLEFSCGSSILGQAMDLARQRGCDVFGLFAFNPPPAGQEQSTRGLVDILGKPCPNYHLVKSWQPAPAAPRHTVFMVYDFESSWAYNASTQHPWASTFEEKLRCLVYPQYVIHTLYRALFDMGYAVDFIRTPGEGAGKTLFLPMHIVHNDEFERNLLHFIQSGGHVVATEDLFRKNADNAYLQTLPLLHALVLGKDANYPSRETLPLTVPYGEGRVTWINSHLPYDSLRPQLESILSSPENHTPPNNAPTAN